MSHFFNFVTKEKSRLPKEARQALHSAREDRTLTGKQRSLLEQLAKEAVGLRESDLSQSQRSVAAVLLAKGYLETRSGSWSGSTYYHLKGAAK